MTIRHGFTPPTVYNSRDLLHELSEIGDYHAQNVIASVPDTAPSRKRWLQSEIRDAKTDALLVLVLAQSDEYLENILRSARIAVKE